MTVITDAKPLALVTYCHLPPIRIASPHIPPDPELFPAAVEGFEDYSVASQFSWFGGAFGLVNISGLTRAELEAGMLEKYPGSQTRVDAIRYLQCLDWAHKGDFVLGFEFARIIAYTAGDDPVVAVPVANGFKRVPHPGPLTPWEHGTLGLFFIDSL